METKIVIQQLSKLKAKTDVCLDEDAQFFNQLQTVKIKVYNSVMSTKAHMSKMDDEMKLLADILEQLHDENGILTRTAFSQEFLEMFS